MKMEFINKHTSLELPHHKLLPSTDQCNCHAVLERRSERGLLSFANALKVLAVLTVIAACFTSVACAVYCHNALAKVRGLHEDILNIQETVKNNAAQDDTPKASHLVTSQSDIDVEDSARSEGLLGEIGAIVAAADDDDYYFVDDDDDDDDAYEDDYFNDEELSEDINADDDDDDEDDDDDDDDDDYYDDDGALGDSVEHSSGDFSDDEELRRMRRSASAEKKKQRKKARGNKKEKDKKKKEEQKNARRNKRNKVKKLKSLPAAQFNTNKTLEDLQQIGIGYDKLKLTEDCNYNSEMGGTYCRNKTFIPDSCMPLRIFKKEDWVNEKKSPIRLDGKKFYVNSNGTHLVYAQVLFEGSSMPVSASITRERENTDDHSLTCMNDCINSNENFPGTFKCTCSIFGLMNLKEKDMLYLRVNNGLNNILHEPEATYMGVVQLNRD